MSGETEDQGEEQLHCAVCGRLLSPVELREIFGGGLLLCAYCRAQQDSCGCED